MAFIVFVDGVLRSQAGSPIYQGLGLYRLLNEGNKVFIACEHKKKDDIWLKQHKINKIDDLIGRDIPAMTEFPEFRQVEWIRSKGPVEMVITSNPELAERLLLIGVTTLLFLQPSYINEAFRPDSKQGRKNWNAIVDEVVKQQEAFVEDPRIVTE